MTADAAASPRPAGRLERWFDWADGRVNPVLVKDLRLLMHGRMFMILYFAVLTLALLLSILFAIIANVDGQDGRVVWGVLFGGTLVACGAVVPFMVFERFRQELSNRATELALMSRLTPARLVRGKLYSAWGASMLLLSAASPMFVTAYLLGGIDVRATVFFVGWMLWAAAVMPAVSLLIATMGTKKASLQALAALVMAAEAVGGIMVAAGFSYSFLFRQELADEEVWQVGGCVCVGGLLLAHFLHQVTVANLRTDRERRDLAPRLALMALEYGGAAMMLALAIWPRARRYHSGFDGDAASALGLGMLFSLCAGCLFLTRTAEKTPASLRGDRAAVRYLFGPGTPRLCGFFLANAVPALLLVAYPPVFMNYTDLDPALVALGAFIAVASGLALHVGLVRPFFRRRGIAGFGAIVTIIAANLLPSVVMVFCVALSDYHPLAKTLLPYISGVSISGLWGVASYSGHLPSGGKDIVLATGLSYAALLACLLLAASLFMADRAPAPAPRK